MAMDLKAIQREVADNLALAGVEKLPSADRVLRRINRAKDLVVGELERLDENQFTYRKDYTVALAATYITLPDGSEVGYPYCRRIIGLHEVIGNDELIVSILDRRSEETQSSPAGFWLYREGARLYFPDGIGSRRATTLRLRYAGMPADLDGTDQDGTFTGIPDEWLDLLVLAATAALLPSGNAGYSRYTLEYTTTLERLRSMWKNQVNAEPARIRCVE